MSFTISDGVGGVRERERERERRRNSETVEWKSEEVCYCTFIWIAIEFR